MTTTPRRRSYHDCPPSSYVLRRVWAAISARPDSSVREIARACRITYGYAAHALRTLAAAGYLAHEPGRHRTYTVIVPLLAGARVVAPEHPGVSATEAD